MWNRTRNHWLLKTEPSQYSYDDLEVEESTVWDGITNPLALRYLRDIQRGDALMIYHTGNERAVVGIARCTRPAMASEVGTEWGWPEIAAVGRLPRPVSLQELKDSEAFQGSPLLRQGRLSVLPLTALQWEVIERLASVGRR
mgnify:FL=1